MEVFVVSVATRAKALGLDVLPTNAAACNIDYLPDSINLVGGTLVYWFIVEFWPNLVLFVSRSILFFPFSQVLLYLSFFGSPFLNFIKFWLFPLYNNFVALVCRIIVCSLKVQSCTSLP